MDQPTATKIIQSLEQGYDAIAEHFAETRMHQWYEVTYLVDRYTHPGETVLDIGCGSGRLAELTNERKVSYIGVDLSAELLAQGEKRFPDNTFLKGSMNEIPLEDNTAETIFAIAAFHHVPSVRRRAEALTEIARVTKHGGHIIMLNWNRHQWRYNMHRWKWNLKKLVGKSDMDWNDVLVPWKKQDGTILAERYYHSFTKKEMERLARMAGVTILDQYYELQGMHVPRRKGQNLVTIFQKG